MTGYCFERKKMEANHTHKEFVEDMKRDKLYARDSVEKLKNGQMGGSAIGTAHEGDVTKARKDHICQNTTCKRKIKKDELYLRRSFGRLWTIKDCSIYCFERVLP